VGLLGGLDDTELFASTGQGRDVNRHVYTAAEIEAALQRHVTQGVLALVRLRSKHPAFTGEFAFRVLSPSALELSWHNGADSAVLVVDVATCVFRIDATGVPPIARPRTTTPAR
jgi:sucrose phosphorylase